MNIKDKIGLKIKNFRIGLGLSQEKLALKAGIDRTYINSVENGRRNISIINIEKLAIALNVHISELFTEETK